MDDKGLPEAPVKARLNRWIILAGVLVIEITMAVGLMPWRNFDRIKTTDFVNFYAAATIVRQGNGPYLYSATTQGAALYAILGQNTGNYFLHPPFFAVVLVPFSYLSVEYAFVLWALLNSALIGLMPSLLGECVSLIAKHPYLGLLGMVYCPVLVTLALGQSSIVLLFILTAGYLLLGKNRDGAAGLILSLATIKFQYVLVIVGLFLIGRKYKLVAGFVLGCAILASISVAITGPAGLVRYITFLRDYNAHNGYDSHQLLLMTNWRGFFMGMGWTNHIQLFSALGSGACLVLGMFISAGSHPARNLDLKFSCYVAIALLVSPYAHFQDVTILLLPLFLVASGVLSGRIPGLMGKAVSGCCGLLFVGPIILLICGGHYWWNSRIYLMFPIILCFFVMLATALLFQPGLRFRQSS